jgi:hypothetical protein
MFYSLGSIIDLLNFFHITACHLQYREWNQHTTKKIEDMDDGEASRNG